MPLVLLLTGEFTSGSAGLSMKLPWETFQTTLDSSGRPTILDYFSSNKFNSVNQRGAVRAFILIRPGRSGTP